MTRRFTAADLEKLTEGTTPAPWEPFHDTWEDYGPDGEVAVEFEQFGVIGGADGILDTNPRPSLMDAPNQWVDSGEHDNLANTRLAAAAPELAAEHHRIITDLEELLDVVKHETWLHDDEGQFPETVQLGNYVVDQLTRILKGEA